MHTIQPDFSDEKTLEKYSSAFTLSDMEIFIFPELFYPLVLSNIMSPIIWEWRKDAWFKDIQKKSFTFKINRIKQFIMDNYVFNLDLETWGLTTKEKEISRFNKFIDTNALAQSNALFGYEGDKYYFDIDIRQHFGLDKYNTNVIPYWKTETIEAMTAFRYKHGFATGAGECVSLAALYAAALFVIGAIPLENIFLMATPLHSQNFIDSGEGVITNNRRIVTKTMWFNGTTLSAKARRAMENETITIVSHVTGLIHTLYPEASINKKSYSHFCEQLKNYLKTPLTAEIFINFLRHKINMSSCFQYRYIVNNKPLYIGMDTIFSYELHTRKSFSGNTRESLLKEIEMEEFNLQPLENKLCICEIENYLDNNPQTTFEQFKIYFSKITENKECKNKDKIINFFDELYNFINVIPKLPDYQKKQTLEIAPLKIGAHQSREEIVQYLVNQSETHETALLALYAYRMMDKIDWKPFIKSAIERNPVSLSALQNRSLEEIYQIISDLPNLSIYSDNRLAQPDEVWNFQRGDGLEKAFLFANIIKNTKNQTKIQITIANEVIVLTNNEEKFSFFTQKHFPKMEIDI